MSHRGSASTYYRLLACQWWARLDAPHEPYVGRAGLLGTETHAYVEDSLGGKATKGLYGPDATAMGDQALHFIDDVGVPTAVELALVYDCATDTARRVATKGPREYGAFKPTEFPMTLDLIWVHDDHVVIRDLKTGKSGHPEQLAIQALGATRLYGKKHAMVGFLWARKTKVNADPLRTFSPDDLEAEMYRLSSVLRRLPVAQPTPGDHCFYCPAWKGCPAKQEPTEEERRTA